MKVTPSREDILKLLDRLDNEPAGALELDVLEFEPWLPNARNNLAKAVELAACFANAYRVGLDVRSLLRGIY